MADFCLSATSAVGRLLPFLVGCYRPKAVSHQLKNPGRVNDPLLVPFELEAPQWRVLGLSYAASRDSSGKLGEGP